MRTLTNTIFGLVALTFLGYWAYNHHHDSADTGKTVVSFLAAGSREQQSCYEQVIREFEARHPDIKIRLEWNSAGDFFGVLLTRMAGGVPPDLTFMYEFKLPHFAKKGTLLDLTPLIRNDFQADWREIHATARRIFTFQDRIYAIPVTMAPLVIFYNKTLFSRAGIPYPDETWTWDTFRQAAIRLTRQDANHRTIQYGLAGVMDYRMIEMTTGRRRLGPDLVHANFLDPQILAAVQFQMDLATRDHVAPDLAAMREQSTVGLFETGKAAMAISGRWMVPTYNGVSTLDYDVAPIPRWKNGHRGTYTHAVGFAICSASRHPKEAWEFLKFLGSRPTAVLLTRLGDTVPVRRSILESPAFRTPKERPAHDDVFAGALDHSHFLQITDPPEPEFYAQAIDSVMVGEAAVPEALRSAQRCTERFFAENHGTLLSAGEGGGQ